MRSENENFAAIVSGIPKLSKGSIEKDNNLFTSQTYFFYISPSNKLKNQVRRISY